MNEFNDLNYMRQKYQQSIDKNITKLQGRLKTLNYNNSKQQTMSSRQQITMTKNPQEIKSMRIYLSLQQQQQQQQQQQKPQSKPLIQQGVSTRKPLNEIVKKYMKSKMTKSRASSKSSAKSKSKSKTKSPSKELFNSRKPLNDIIKKYIKSKIPKNRTTSKSPAKSKSKSKTESPQKDLLNSQKKRKGNKSRKRNDAVHLNGKLSNSKSKSKSKSKTKSPQKEQHIIQKKRKGTKSRKRNDAVHLNGKLSPSPKVTKFQIKDEKENSPNIQRHIRALSKLKPKQQNQSPIKSNEVNTQRLKNLMVKNKKLKLEIQNNPKKIKSKIKFPESVRQQIQYTSMDDIKGDEPKYNSLRLNTYSGQKSYQTEEVIQKPILTNIYEEVNKLNDDQMEELLQYIQSQSHQVIKQQLQFQFEQEQEEKKELLQEIEKNQFKDEALQTSINLEQENYGQTKSSPKYSNMIEQHWKMAQEEFPERSIQQAQQQKSQFISNQQIEELCSQREQGIITRVNSQIKAFEKLLECHKISPRSFHQNKQVIQSWSQKQAEQLKKLRNELMKAQKLQLNLIKKTEQDLQLANDFNKDQTLALNQLCINSFVKQKEQVSFDQSEIKESESYLDQSDLQFSLPNSPKVQTPISKQDSQRSQTQQQQSQSSQPPKNPIIDYRRRDLVIQNFFQEDQEKLQNIQGKQLCVSPNNMPSQLNLDQQFQKNTQEETTQQKIDSVSQVVLNQLIDETSNSFHKIQGAAEMIQKQNEFEQQQQKQYFEGAIRTNVGVVRDNVEKIIFYLVETYLEQFIQKMNFPYGRMPIDRLRLLHGYDDILHIQDFVIQEYIFIELQQLLQCQSEYEQIHNLAIFNCFNEVLNQFRPFYMVNGLPYPWSYSNLTVVLFTNDNVQILMEKAKQKVCEYASSLCGLLSDEDSEQSVKNFDSLQVLQYVQGLENDCLIQMREERLSKVLEIENNELESQWYNYDERKTEVLMEVTDSIFEQLIEEMTIDLL